MRITRIKAVQAHPVPDSVRHPRGPFPRELFAEPEIVVEYSSEQDESGREFDVGATAQNNYQPPKYYYCKYCHERVVEFDLDLHECDIEDDEDDE
jgi:hypothetical protein